MCGCLLRTPNWGPGPQPRPVPWLGIKPVTLWFSGRRSIHWATPARAINVKILNYVAILIFLIWYSLFKSILGSLNKMEVIQASLNLWEVLIQVFFTDYSYLQSIYIYTHTHMLSLTNMAFIFGEYYAEWNKPVKERQIPYDFTYMWNPMNKINKIETDS